MLQCIYFKAYIFKTSSKSFPLSDSELQLQYVDLHSKSSRMAPSMPSDFYKFRTAYDVVIELIIITANEHENRPIMIGANMSILGLNHTVSVNIYCLP